MMEDRKCAEKVKNLFFFFTFHMPGLARGATPSTNNSRKGVFQDLAYTRASRQPAFNTKEMTPLTRNTANTASVLAANQ